jgi:hypothetical protein
VVQMPLSLHPRPLSNLQVLIEIKLYVMTSRAGILSVGDSNQANDDGDERFHFWIFLHDKNNNNLLLKIYVNYYLADCYKIYQLCIIQ